MRRIPKLRRPSDLPSSCIPPLASHHPQLAASFSSSTPQFTAARSTASLPRSITTNTSRSLHFARFYSTGNHPIPQSLAEPSQEQDDTTQAQQQQQQLYKPPPPRSYAARTDEISDTGYAPATSADDLETVGDLDSWWEKDEHWGEGSNFVGFRPREKTIDPLVLETSVRRAVAEAFALRQAGREHDLIKVWPVGGEESLRRVVGLGLKSENGHVSFDGDVADVVRGLRWGTGLSQGGKQESAPVELEITDASQSTPVVPSEEVLELKKAWDQSWKRIPLSDPRIKFAVTKRLFQLTGQLVPDHKLPNIYNVQGLLEVVQAPPKPKTLTEEIQKRGQDLLNLPNVSVATKRVTRGDKEQAVGRLKLMQEELRKRDLPLEGHGYARKNREMARFRGGV